MVSSIINNMFKGKSKQIDYLKKLALFQSAGIFLYIALVSLIFWQGNNWFGPHAYLGPILVLLLFSVSAMICGLIMFYKPFRLFLDNKKEEAVKLVLYSAGFLVLFFLILLILVILI